MEMTMPGEANVNLPISGASIGSTSAGTSGTVLKRSGLQPGAFSEKLSVALDKPVQSESVEKKPMEKTKTDDGEGTQLEKALQGLPFGLIWSPPVPELLASALNAVKQKGASNADVLGASWNSKFNAAVCRWRYRSGDCADAASDNSGNDGKTRVD